MTPRTRKKRRIKKHVSFRLTKLNTYALAEYERATKEQTSRTINKALQLFFPPDYIAAAQARMTRLGRKAA